MFRSGHGTRLTKNIRDFNMCTEFEMLKAKVPTIFSAQWVSLEDWKKK